MKKENWEWMPHPGHFICSSDCKFILSTYVGGYIVSTVGEYLPDSGTREIHAEVRGIKLEGKGDTRKQDFLKKCDYIEVGCNRKYETMVFKAKKRKDKYQCCPYVVSEYSELDFLGYNSATKAKKGHYNMCKKWADKHSRRSNDRER